MTAVNRTSLYAYFTTGAKPTQSQFDDLIDSCLNLATTSAQVITSDISANGRLTVNAAIVVGTPTGGDKGTGTVNATGIYVNGTLITTTSGGGSGTVNVGVSGQIAFYNMNSNSVNGTNTLPDNTIATTRALGTSNTQLATTGFANPGANLIASGDEKYPSGSIEQWGILVFDASGNANITFPIPFPNEVFSITGNVQRGSILNNHVVSTQIGTPNLNGVSVYGSFSNPSGFGNLDSNSAFYWRAKGR